MSEVDPERYEQQQGDEDDLAVALQQSDHTVSPAEAPAPRSSKNPCILAYLG
jgi:hypothetical protein